MTYRLTMDEHTFRLDSDEFEQVEKLAIEWCKLMNHTEGFSNYDEGEAAAYEFKRFVEEKYPAVAKLVERDSTIYLVALELMQ